MKNPYTEEWLQEVLHKQSQAMLGMEAKRKLGVRLPHEVPESEIQDAILNQLLRPLDKRGVLTVVRVNAGSLAGTYYQASEPGMTDLVLSIGTHGIWAEIKRPGETLDPDQVEFRDRVLKSGGNHYTLHSLEEAKQMLRDFEVQI